MGTGGRKREKATFASILFVLIANQEGWSLLHRLSIILSLTKAIWSCSGIATTGSHYVSCVTTRGKRGSKDLAFSSDAIATGYR